MYLPAFRQQTSIPPFVSSFSHIPLNVPPNIWHFVHMTQGEFVGHLSKIALVFIKIFTFGDKNLYC